MNKRDKVIAALCIILCAISSYITWQLTRRSNEFADLRVKLAVHEAISERGSTISEKAGELSSQKNYIDAGVGYLQAANFYFAQNEKPWMEIGGNRLQLAKRCFQMEKTLRRQEINSDLILAKMFPDLKLQEIKPSPAEPE